MAEEQTAIEQDNTDAHDTGPFGASSDASDVESGATEGDNAGEQRTALNRQDAMSSDGAGDGDAQSEDEVSDGEEKENVVPESYDEFSLPEGYATDEGLLNDFSELALADGLSQDKAQAYVDLAARAVNQAYEAQMNAWAEQQSQWSDDVKQLGDQAVRDANFALNRLEAPERFVEWLEDSGMGNHPDLVDVFAKVGNMLREDSFAKGGNQTRAPSIAERLYKSMAPDT